MKVFEKTRILQLLFKRSTAGVRPESQSILTNTFITEKVVKQR